MTKGEMMVWSATFAREVCDDPRVARRAAILAHRAVELMRVAAAQLDGSEPDGVDASLLTMLDEYEV